MTTREAIEARYQKIGRSLNDMVHNHVLEDAKGKKLKVFKYGDNIFPPFGDLAISKIKDLEIRDDDVLLMGYPKTGCHWTFELLAMILQGRAKNEGVGKIVGFLEMCAPQVVSAQPSPRILNTHITFDQLPKQVYSKKTKIVLTMRNPKDVLVSYYNHHKNMFQLHGYDGEWEDYVNMFLEGKVDYGSYLDYIMDWEKTMKENPDHPILVMSYEDMKEDPIREIRKLAKFLGVTLEGNLAEEIAQTGNFDSMQSSGRFSHHITRKGQVGDWKNWLTVAQNENMDAVLKEKMAGVTIFTPRYTLP